MWFEKLEVTDLPAQAAEGLYAVIYYYFTAFVTGALVWALWRIFELRSDVLHNVAALLLLTGLMLGVLEGLRSGRQWARIVLFIEYSAFLLLSAYYLILSVSAIWKEYSAAMVTAICVYTMLIVLWAYGVYQLSANPKVKTITWR